MHVCMNVWTYVSSLHALRLVLIFLRGLFNSKMRTIRLELRSHRNIYLLRKFAFLLRTVSVSFSYSCDCCGFFFVLVFLRALTVIHVLM